MNNWFRLLILALFCGVLPVSGETVSAQQSPAAILKKATRAVGGEKALRAVNSREATGRVKRLSDGASGEFNAMSQQPNLYTERFDAGGFETAVGFNGKSGWFRDAQNGLRTLTGAASRDFQAEANYRNNLWLNYKQDKSKIMSGGRAEVNGKSANVVVLTTAKNATTRLYFDSVSGLPVRDDISTNGLAKTFEYDDFRTVDGVSEPFAITATIGTEKYEIKLEKVTHNAQVSRAEFDFPKLSNEPLPDIPTLVKEVQAHEDQLDAILEKYTYTQTNIKREISKDGALRETELEKFQVTTYKGYVVLRLIAKNGKPLASDEQTKEDERAAKRITEIEREASKKEERKVQQTASGAPNGDVGQRISIAEVLRASNLVNPRRERFRNRDVIVFDFEPNPNFDFSDAKTFLKFFGKTSGVIWIDEADKQVARVEAVLSDSFKVGGGLVANLKKGAAFTLEQERVGNEVWLPSNADINLSVKVLLVKGININASIRYGNYEKFNSEVKNANVDEIKKP